jgi:predicted secreted protein
VFVKIETFLAIYFVVWWIVLFAVLPWGMRTQEEEGEVTLGTPASAPANLRLGRKAIWTTIVAALLVGVFWLIGAVFGVSFEGFVAMFSTPPQ